MKDLPIHIIIDGADGLGKTTVCQKVGRVLQLPVVKMPNMKEYVEKGSAEEFSKLFNETIVQFSEYDFVLDRGFTSSMVYNKVFRRDFDTSYITRIQNTLKPYVYILTGRIPKDQVEGHIGYFDYFRNDELYNYEQVEMVDQEFCKMADTMRFKLIEVWGKSPEEITKIIVDDIYEKRK